MSASFTPRIGQRYINERQEDLDVLEELLRLEGVVVKRPRRLESVSPILTPHFASTPPHRSRPETCSWLMLISSLKVPTNRKRFVEQYLLRDIFRDYFDRGASWLAAPNPTLSDTSRSFFLEDTIDGPVPQPSSIDSALDIAFDAENVLKFGRDLIFNVETLNHALGR
jgi:glycine amidinotransferase